MIQVSIALLISIAVLIAVSRYFKLHAFFALLLAAVLFGLIMGKPFREIFTSMQSGFGLLFLIAKLFMFCMKGYDYIFIERKHRKQDLIEKQNKNELDSRTVNFVKKFDKEFNDKE